MAAAQPVGFSQRIQLPWLEFTAQLTLAGKTHKEANKALQEHLSDKLSVGHQVQRGNREKAITILLKIWHTPPADLITLRDDGLEMLQRLPSAQHFALHWGMSMAVYPFFGSVAGVVGKLLRLQDQITTAQVQRRIREQLGERETVARAARRIYRMFIDWKILIETTRKGVYKRPTSIGLPTTYLTGWLYECLIRSNGGGWTPKNSLPGHPSLFPFRLNSSPREALQGRTRLESITQGLDEELIHVVSNS
ncbi:MAG: hypothetical protein R3F07_11980 [Opitutaceae bacterium]